MIAGEATAEVTETVAGAITEAAGKKPAVSAPFTGETIFAGMIPEIPEAVIGRALTSGGNDKNTVLRIVAFYQKSSRLNEAAAFLRKEYGEGGKGVTVGGRQYALWFDKDGIRMAEGRRAAVPGYTFVSWERAAGIVENLLDNGLYAAKDSLDRAGENERREIAEKLWYLCQDLSDKAGEDRFLPCLTGLFRSGGFPDATERIAGELVVKESRDVIARELAAFTGAYGTDRGLLRFHFHKPEELLSRLQRLNITPKTFPIVENFEPAKGSFITEDEIDRMLTQGSNVSEGKMRICSYFMQGHDAKECTDFLKNEYGIGGFGCTGYNEWHDGKGIRYTRSDDISGFDGYDTVLLNWDKVQKRVIYKKE